MRVVHCLNGWSESLVTRISILFIVHIRFINQIHVTESQGNTDNSHNTIHFITFCTCYSSNSSNLRVAAFVYKPRREISFCSSAYIVSLIRQESISWKICFMRNSPTKLYLTSCPTYPEIWSEFQNLDHKLLLFCFEEKSVPFKLPPFTCQVLMLVDVNR